MDGYEKILKGVDSYLTSLKRKKISVKDLQFQRDLVQQKIDDNKKKIARILLTDLVWKVEERVKGTKIRNKGLHKKVQKTALEHLHDTHEHINDLLDEMNHVKRKKEDLVHHDGKHEDNIHTLIEQRKYLKRKLSDPTLSLKEHNIIRDKIKHLGEEKEDAHNQRDNIQDQLQHHHNQLITLHSILEKKDQDKKEQEYEVHTQRVENAKRGLFGFFHRHLAETEHHRSRSSHKERPIKLEKRKPKELSCREVRRCNTLIEKSRRAQVKGHLHRAKHYYVKARNTYITLDYDKRKEIYAPLDTLYEELARR